MKDFDGLTLILPLITIALIAVSLWLSVNRRRTLLQLAVGVSLLMIVERRGVLHEQSALASAAHNPQVAQSVLGDLLHGFFVLTAWVLAAALIVLVIAVLSGPYRWAVAIRSWVKRTWHTIAGASSGNRHSPVVTWIASHAAGLQLAGAVVAGILLLIVSVSWLSFLIIGVLLAAYEVYLQRIKPPPPDEAPVLVENSATGLTGDFYAAMISVRVCDAGLPAAGDRGVLARVAGAILLVQGRGDPCAPARGRGAAPGDSEAPPVLERPGGACRARPGSAEGTARTADRDPGHAAALASPHGRGEVASAQITWTPADPG